MDLILKNLNIKENVDKNKNNNEKFIRNEYADDYGNLNNYKNQFIIASNNCNQNLWSG